MTLISHRECHLVLAKNEDINRFVEEIKAFLEKEMGAISYFEIDLSEVNFKEVTP